MDVKGIIRSLIEQTISEAVEIDHSRYMRAHSKKAKGDGNWMFTSKEMGEPKDGEMVTVSGQLSAAAKEAAKKLKTNRVYVMEEVELDEDKSADYERVRALMPSSMPVDKWIPIKNGFEAIVSSKGSYNLRRKVKMAGEVRYEKFSLTRSGGLKSLGFSKMEESLDEVAIIKNGRKFSNVKWFETEKGANDFLEKNPDFGVIQADNGGVYVANNKNKGTPVK